MSKTWLLFKLRGSSMFQQLISFVKKKINLIDNKRQKTITLGLTQFNSILLIRQERITLGPIHFNSIPLIRQKTITSHLANISNSISLICKLIITPGPA